MVKIKTLLFFCIVLNVAVMQSSDRDVTTPTNISDEESIGGLTNSFARSPQTPKTPKKNHDGSYRLPVTPLAKKPGTLEQQVEWQLQAQKKFFRQESLSLKPKKTLSKTSCDDNEQELQKNKMATAGCCFCCMLGFLLLIDIESEYCSKPSSLPTPTKLKMV